MKKRVKIVSTVLCVVLSVALVLSNTTFASAKSSGKAVECSNSVKSESIFDWIGKVIDDAASWWKNLTSAHYTIKVVDESGAPIERADVSVHAYDKKIFSGNQGNSKDYTVKTGSDGSVKIDIKALGFGDGYDVVEITNVKADGYDEAKGSGASNISVLDWDKLCSLVKVDSNWHKNLEETVVLKKTPVTYTVTFTDINGIVKTETVMSNAESKAVTAPTNTTFSSDVANVNGNITWVPDGEYDLASLNNVDKDMSFTEKYASVMVTFKFFCQKADITPITDDKTTGDKTDPKPSSSFTSAGSSSLDITDLLNEKAITDKKSMMKYFTINEQAGAEEGSVESWVEKNELESGIANYSDTNWYVIKLESDGWHIDGMAKAPKDEEEPADPSDPVTPGEQGDPVNPGTQDEPSDPVNPGTQDEPSDPVNPGTQDEPSDPSNQGEEPRENPNNNITPADLSELPTVVDPSLLPQNEEMAVEETEVPESDAEEIPEEVVEVTPEEVPVSEPEDIEVPEEEVPAGEPEELEVAETEVPAGEAEELELPETEVPAGEALPKTGTTPVAVFYGIGGACIVFGAVAAVVVRKRKRA